MKHLQSFFENQSVGNFLDEYIIETDDLKEEKFKLYPRNYRKIINTDLNLMLGQVSDEFTRQQIQDFIGCDLNEVTKDKLIERITEWFNNGYQELNELPLINWMAYKSIQMLSYEDMLMEEARYEEEEKYQDPLLFPDDIFKNINIARMNRTIDEFKNADPKEVTPGMLLSAQKAMIHEQMLIHNQRVRQKKYEIQQLISKHNQMIGQMRRQLNAPRISEPTKSETKKVNMEIKHLKRQHKMDISTQIRDMKAYAKQNMKAIKKSQKDLRTEMINHRKAVIKAASSRQMPRVTQQIDKQRKSIFMMGKNTRISQITDNINDYSIGKILFFIFVFIFILTAYVLLY
jgi:hypothetical protein